MFFRSRLIFKKTKNILIAKVSIQKNIKFRIGLDLQLLILKNTLHMVI